MTLKNSVKTLESQKKTQKSQLNISKKYACDFCGREVVRVETLARHMEKCVHRDKFLMRDTQEGKMAFDLWATVHKNPTIQRFEKSNLYPSFIDFTVHCYANNYHLIYEFGVWLIQNKISPTKWKKQEVFQSFIGLYLLQETPRDAVTRSLTYIFENGLYGSFFKSYECSKIILCFETGRISPWILFVSHNPEDFLNRLTTMQADYFQKVVNMDVWPKKVERFKKTVDRLREELKGVDI